MLDMLKEKGDAIKAGAMLLIILSAFFVVKTVDAIKELGRDGAPGYESTISVSGEGEIFAVPDVAVVTFSSRHEAKTVAAAQALVSGQMEKALAALRDAGIEERDIKTLSYNSYPKYEYQDSGIRCISYPCSTNKQVIVGYEVSQTVSVKIRDTESAPSIVEILGTVGVSDMNGPNFSIDDEDSLRALARKQAIDDAKQKAKILAKDLDVKLVRIVNFSENGGYYPMYAGYDMSESAVRATSAVAPAPDLPEGENKISSTVTIIYEIR